MTRHPAQWFLPAAAAALSLQLTGCTGASTTTPSVPPDSTTSRENTNDTSDTEPTGTDRGFALLGDEADDIEGVVGSYGLTARGSGTPPVAVMDLPAGFSSFGPWMFWPFDDGSQGAGGPPLRAVQYWTVNGVYSDPCRRPGAAPEIGPGVGDLVTALTAQRRTEVSESRPVSLDGYDGVTLDLDVPEDLPVERCTEGLYMFWEGSPGDAHHQAAPDAVERLWVLDVAGQRVVLATLVDPEVPDDDRKELIDIVESVRFVEPQ